LAEETLGLWNGWHKVAALLGEAHLEKNISNDVNTLELGRFIYIKLT
jgi:hypothetical protein